MEVLPQLGPLGSAGPDLDIILSFWWAQVRSTRSTLTPDHANGSICRHAMYSYTPSIMGTSVRSPEYWSTLLLGSGEKFTQNFASVRYDVPGFLEQNGFILNWRLWQTYRLAFYTPLRNKHDKSTTVYSGNSAENFPTTLTYRCIRLAHVLNPSSLILYTVLCLYYPWWESIEEARAEACCCQPASAVTRGSGPHGDPCPHIYF